MQARLFCQVECDQVQQETDGSNNTDVYCKEHHYKGEFLFHENELINKE